MKISKVPVVRLACTKEFTDIFRAILYSAKLTYGAKCLLLAILDLPTKDSIKWAKLARKLKTNSSTISKWKKEILATEVVVKNGKTSIR